MKRWKKPGVFLLTVALAISLLSGAAYASGERFKVYTVADGEELSVGFAFLLDNNGEQFLLCSNYNDSYSFYVKEGQQNREMEKLQEFEDIAIYTSAVVNDSYYLPVRCPAKGENVYIEYTIEESDKIYTEAINATVGELVRNRRNNAVMSLEYEGEFAGTVELFQYPALAYLDDDCIAGALVEMDGEFRLALFWYDEAAYNAAIGSEEDPADEPAEEPAETPAEEPAEEPADEPAEEPSGEGSEEPEGEEPADKAEPNPGVALDKDGTQTEEEEKTNWPLILMIIFGCAAAIGVAAFILVPILRKKKASQQTDISGDPVPIPIPGEEQRKTMSYADQSAQPQFMATLPRRTAKLYLMCSGGYQDGRKYPVTGTIKIGRNPDNTIRYPADYSGVSRSHVTLTLNNNSIYLTDTSSTGTYLLRPSSGAQQPTRVPKGTPVMLKPGDLFYLGEQKNEYRVISE